MLFIGTRIECPLSPTIRRYCGCSWLGKAVPSSDVWSAGCSCAGVGGFVWLACWCRVSILLLCMICLKSNGSSSSGFLILKFPGVRGSYICIADFGLFSRFWSCLSSASNLFAGIVLSFIARYGDMIPLPYSTSLSMRSAPMIALNWRLMRLICSLLALDRILPISSRLSVMPLVYWVILVISCSYSCWVSSVSGMCFSLCPRRAGAGLPFVLMWVEQTRRKSVV